MKKYANCLLWIFLGAFCGFLVYGAVYEFIYPDEFGIGIVFWGGLIYAGVVAVPYSLLLFLLGRKKADSVLVPMRLFLSTAAITGITSAWLGHNSEVIGGHFFAPFTIAVVGAILYAVAYAYFMGKRNDDHDRAEPKGA